MSPSPRIGVVAIGRNEGERLKRCLNSVVGHYPIVYVDSGSTDGSVEFAQGIGVIVERLSTDKGFTAARARNAGWRRLLAEYPGTEFVQFVDGDCEIDAAWIPRAEAEMGKQASLCAVFGRRRERFAQASPYNALCDDEWNAPIGDVDACGGDVLFRIAALRQAEGYSDDLIAGEEPDLCLRLGRAGWIVRRIDAEMTLHDAAISRAGQWWLRYRRAGHAFAEHVARHGAHAFPTWRKERNSTLIWALALPAVIAALGIVALAACSWIAGGLALLLLALYPAQMLRIARKKAQAGADPAFARIYGLWMVLGRFAQFGGIWRYHWKRWRGGTLRIIEYKGASDTPQRN